MNYRAKKRAEAERLRERMISTKYFSYVGVSVKRGSVAVTFDLATQHYVFPVNISYMRKTEVERTAMFDKFVADCIIHAGQMRAIKIAMEKNIKNG